MKKITMKEIRDQRNYTVWSGYVETPVSFNPLGDVWIGDLNPEGKKMSLKKWIKLYENDMIEILEDSGFKVIEDKKKLKEVV
jgi:hypothetical protein